MLMCPYCGNVIDEEDLETYYECHGHDGLSPIREKMVSWRCSECGHEYEEAEKCQVCGEYFIPQHYKYHVCEDCMLEHENLKNALDIGTHNKIPVKINGFVDSCLTEDQINEILVNYIEGMIKEGDKKIREYCEEDKDYFGDWIVEEIEKEKARAKNGEVTQ